MIDKERVSGMIKDIERYLSDLATMDISKKSDLESKEKYYALSMLVFAVMNRVLDVANEVISGSKDLPTPGYYGETFDILLKGKVISQKTSVSMKNLTKYRNIIAHEYYHLSVQELFKLRKEIRDAESFIEEVRGFIRRSQ